MSESGKMLKKKKFVKYNADGMMEKIFCKVCGDPIAAMQMVPAGSGRDAMKMEKRFRRFNNYTEAKLELTDNNFHVTNCCRNCIAFGTDRKQLTEMYKADMADLGMRPSKLEALKVVAIDVTGVGII